MPQSPLEQIAIIHRQTQLAANSFDSSAPANGYSETHTKALSDTTTPVHGKGTGVSMDTTNGGSDVDINGNVLISKTGRVQNMAINPYDTINGYTTPNTAANVGQVQI
jgi:hypothetical protein